MNDKRLWDIGQLRSFIWVVNIVTHQGERVVVADMEQDARAIAVAWSNTGAMVVVWEL